MSSLSCYDLEREMRRLDDEDYSKKNKDVIKKFVNDLKIKDNLSEVRLISYTTRLRVIARWIPDKFLSPNKDDMDQILTELADKRNDYTENTRTAYIIVIRRFYKWLLGNNKTYPEFLEEVRRSRNRNHVEPENLITPDELRALLDSCTNPRDRALFSTLYDSGARLGELLTMRIKDFIGDKNGALLSVNGKTGHRQIRVIGDSIAYLRAWLDYHPDRQNPDAYLFCGLSKHTMGRPLDYNETYSIFRRTTKRAGFVDDKGNIKRRIHPHLFRHTRATILAKVVPEAPLESQMGWIHGSKQTQTYVHLSLRDQDNAILRGYGKKVKEDGEISNENEPKECPRCRTLNESTAKYCRICWLPFDIKEALEVEQKEHEIEKAVEDSNVLSPLVKTLIKNASQTDKVKALNTLLGSLLNDSEMKELGEAFIREVRKIKS
ncbi:MAG: tyrosine-type recombinase/integrase [Candidatus Thermoplasmatota archaeon]|jgi:integrase|nr:tyrosine-type recombinase/integrase [Candidatus Thermoplasmatota archaeon]